MAMYVPYFVETLFQSPAPSFPTSPVTETASHVPEILDATAHRLAPCIRKRPISLLEDIPRDLCTTHTLPSNDDY